MRNTIRCPHCGNPADAVTDSRYAKRRNAIRRRRRCACGNVVTTFEHIRGEDQHEHHLRVLINLFGDLQGLTEGMLHKHLNS